MSTSTFWALVRVRTDGTVRGAEEGPGRLSLLGGTPSRGSYVVASAGILGSRVPTPTLALHLGECQGGPGVPPGGCQTAWRGPRRLPVAADRRGPGRARPGRRGDRGRRARRARDPGPAPALDLGGPRGRGPHAGRAAPPGGAEVRGPGRPHVLHARRARAGHPAERGHPSGGAAPGRGHPLRRRPGLRDRRRPAGVRAGRDHRGRRRAGPRPRRGGAGQPRRPRARRRRPRGRRDHARHVALRRGLRRPRSSGRPGPHVPRRRVDPALDRSSRACCAATRASRSRRASRTASCRTAWRPSGSATTAR